MNTKIKTNKEPEIKLQDPKAFLDGIISQLETRIDLLKSEINKLIIIKKNYIKLLKKVEK